MTKNNDKILLIDGSEINQSMEKDFLLGLYRDQFKALELDIDSLTKEQVDAILIPSEAPEVFAADGELSAEESMRNWKRQLVAVGLNKEQIQKAVQLNFGL